MDLLTLTLTAAAILVPLDLVRNSHSLERARTHDRAILRLLGITTVALLTVDLVAGLTLALGALGWWREGSLRNLLLAAGLAAIWLAAPLVQPLGPWIALGWLALALLEGAVTLWFWGAAKRWWPARTTFAETLPLWPLSGFRAQHTLFAAGLALLLPLAWLVPPQLVLSATPPLVGYAELRIPVLGVLWILMLIGISSWVGVLAGLIGLAVVEPMLAHAIGAGIFAALLILLPRFLYDHPSWLDVLPRGDSLDSVKGRWRMWSFLVGTIRRWSWRTWLTGRGWDGTNQDLLRAQAMHRVKQTHGTAHNDVLDLVYTSGGLGVLLLVVLGWRLGTALTLGDPWSAVVVTGVVIALGSSALRYPSIGGVWWLSAAFVAGRTG